MTIRDRKELDWALEMGRLVSEMVRAAEAYVSHRAQGEAVAAFRQAYNGGQPSPNDPGESINQMPSEQP